MSDSSYVTHPKIAELASRAAEDFKNDTQPADNYLNDRLSLISEIGAHGLRSVDQALAQAIKRLPEVNEFNGADGVRIQRRLEGLALVLQS